MGEFIGTLEAFDILTVIAELIAPFESRK